MVRHMQEQRIDTIDGSVRGGTGIVRVRYMLDGMGEMQGKGRTFCHTVLEPGAAIGLHRHEGESEFFYLLCGEGEFCDNGDWVRVGRGDVLATHAGETHALRNTGAQSLEFVGLVLFS